MRAPRPSGTAAAGLGLLLLLASPARAEFLDGTLRVGGKVVAVRWNDGDSFQFLEGEHRKRRARLTDVNTLENYGPVHRWGTWTRWELYALSRESGPIAASQEWKCTVLGKPDRYQRLLVECPALARELVRTGQAMVFAVDKPAPPELLSVQRAAQRRKLGMWKKGVPPALPTGAHSVLEGKGYDRVVDTATGAAQVIPHDRAYELCEDTCVGSGAAQACLVYVPFRRRYREPPPCLTDPRVQPLPPAKPRPKVPTE